MLVDAETNLRSGRRLSWPRCHCMNRTNLQKKNGKAANATGMRVAFINMTDEADLIRWLDAANRTLQNIRHERAAHKVVELFMDIRSPVDRAMT